MIRALAVEMRHLGGIIALSASRALEHGLLNRRQHRSQGNVERAEGFRQPVAASSGTTSSPRAATR